MKKKIIILGAAACFLAACSGNEKPVDLTEAKASGSKKYETGTITEKALSSYARLPGQLNPFNEVNLFPKANGFVKQIFVDRGSQVTKGQLLITLEAPEMESQLQAANSRYLQAQETANASKEKYNRLKQAATEPGSVSPLDLDNAVSRMKSDMAIANAERSNMESVKTMQGYLKIYAPFDGTIVQRNVSPGALVAPGKGTDQPMLVLQDTRKLRLEVAIPEDYVDKVDLKQAVTFTFNAMPGKEHTAKISRSANALGNMRSEAIEIDVINKDGQLKPGMYAEVKIPMLSGAKSLLVPNTAIVRSTEREYVITVKDGKAKLVDIKEGLAGKDSTEVFGALVASDRIVTKAGDDIKDGTVIN
ncbi:MULTISPECIES: efflux RND transporter periplasmic adaptor subunit [unclassified Mucilaginibacter]|uniref:efflux RND transporter periplasmic adaptor subunit n=1 Tax=unclassified Mucilaginibacter TaxID=2617802 RepID=UPI002AC89BBB|nr:MULTISPECIES: efflux RND transporter periplasmic adaptor subunit [unclassified Mucilaginibacter]MEB0248576.1 efflux RND transporter periplasmic adaptor subunit [Mucilaginibacter sp. 5B2]MEB0262941.1 efflux RND transporter periplasmic adaptor subunit [Mucilaginibacter sp. 10I4]MEB0278210.1 efflux RND transporter periplasmic adaptor subunit [Mucilaginibacter sp. 10B2]MEB0302494.1 efflux RND transporter periplasmic adaptor subunit [Mucilaginibacter sp. 5C4]WPX23856.1 efflux RND transporter per